MQRIGDMLPRAEEKAPAIPAGRAFVQEYHTCPEHGQYPANRLDEEGVERWVPAVCPRCAKISRMKALYARAEIGERFKHCDFGNYRVENEGQRVVLDACQSYAEQFPEMRRRGACLILRGHPGTGKNHLATAIMKAVLRQGYTALRLKAAVFLEAFWAKDFGERDRWVYDMAHLDLLVIDEIGRASNSQAAADAFFRLIDGRYEAVRPTIIISNLDRDGLRETLGAAAYDRLTEGGGRLINFDWNSQRGRD